MCHPLHLVMRVLFILSSRPHVEGMDRYPALSQRFCVPLSLRQAGLSGVVRFPTAYLGWQVILH